MCSPRAALPAALVPQGEGQQDREGLRPPTVTSLRRPGLLHKHDWERVTRLVLSLAAASCGPSHHEVIKGTAAMRGLTGTSNQCFLVMAQSRKTPVRTLFTDDSFHQDPKSKVRQRWLQPRAHTPFIRRSSPARSQTAGGNWGHIRQGERDTAKICSFPALWVG